MRRVPGRGNVQLEVVSGLLARAEQAAHPASPQLRPHLLQSLAEMELSADHERLYRQFFEKLEAESDASTSWRQRFDDLSAQFLRQKTAAHGLLQGHWDLWRAHVIQCRAQAAAVNASSYLSGPPWESDSSPGRHAPSAAAAAAAAAASADEATFWSNKLSGWLFGSAAAPADLDL